MKLMLESFSLSFAYLRKDKLILLFSTIPILLGTLLYYFLARWLYVDLLGAGKQWIVGRLSEGTISSILNYILVTIFTIALFFIINWTFVLVVSLFGAPFNDSISQRVVKMMGNEEQTSLSETFSAMISNSFKTIFNELKKISLIIVITLLSIVIGLIPILVPVSIALTAFLLASEFLDYSWSRDKLSAIKCFKDLFSRFFTNGISGGIFLVLMAIPIVNLISFPLGVIYFTIIYHKNKNVTESLP